MKVKQLTLESSEFPKRLRTIPTPPKELYILSSTDVNELLQHPCLAVIGSRKVSAYGKAMTSGLAGELAKAGVVIISGLALGMDGIAHQATIDAGGLTIAVLPTGFNRIYPATHHGLAQQILSSGGALISEYPPDAGVTHKGVYIARNRIVSGLCDALLITEAATKSGTLHTAEFALEQGKDVLAVPGNITSPTSAGTNNLIKAGATPVTDVSDVFHALGIEQGKTAHDAPTSSNPNEQLLLDLLVNGTSDGRILLEESRLPVTIYNQALTMLEIRGHIRPLGNDNWGLQ